LLWFCLIIKRELLIVPLSNLVSSYVMWNRIDLAVDNVEKLMGDLNLAAERVDADKWRTTAVQRGLCLYLYLLLSFFYSQWASNFENFFCWFIFCFVQRSIGKHVQFFRIQ
jgi:hypothetical protein